MRDLRILLSLALFIAPGALLACAGKDETPGSAATPASTATQTSGTAPDGGNASDELRGLAGRLASKDVKATYRLSTTYDGESGEQVLTLYWRPPDTWRLDFLKPGEHSSFLSNARTAYWCSTDDNVGSCLPSPVGLGVPVPFAELFTSPASRSSFIDAQLAGLDIERSSRQVAGREATCFSVPGDIAVDRVAIEYCFSGDGLLLLVMGRSGDLGDFTLEATSLEGSVSDADFEPPYPVQELEIP